MFSYMVAALTLLTASCFPFLFGHLRRSFVLAHHWGDIFCICDDVPNAFSRKRISFTSFERSRASWMIVGLEGLFVGSVVW